MEKLKVFVNKIWTFNITLKVFIVIIITLVFATEIILHAERYLNNISIIIIIITCIIKQFNNVFSTDSQLSVIISEIKLNINIYCREVISENKGCITSYETRKFT